MTDTFTASELRFERTLSAPVEMVWQYLTDSELRSRWFMGGSLDERVGGEIEFIFDHDRLSDGDVPMPAQYADKKGRRWTEQILRYDPPHAIAYTFGIGSTSVATFELSDAGDGTTLLTLVHSKIPNAEAAANFGGGWASHLDVLERRIAGRPVENFWTLHAAAEQRAKAALA